MKDKLISVKNATVNFVSRHRVAIAVAATAAPLIALQVRTATEYNTFLKEHDLYDEYYKMDEI